MDHPENETMEVLVIVAFPDLHTQHGEKASEKDIVNAVSAAVYADKTLDTIAVRPLEYEDCEWIFRGRDADARLRRDGRPGRVVAFRA